jgi:cellulose biosynthesis protein BcsQ
MNKENGLFYIMTDDEYTFSDVMRRVSPERFTPPDTPLTSELYLLPSSKGTTMIPIEQPSPFKFRYMLEEMANLLELDFIVVDTGPTASMFDGSVNFAADYFVYVTECAALSFDGLSESINEINQLNIENSRYRDWETQILGIIPNKARFGTNNHRDNIRRLAQAFPGLLFAPITLRTVWELASEFGQMVYSYAPDGQEAIDAWKLVDQVEGKIYARA